MHRTVRRGRRAAAVSLTLAATAVVAVGAGEAADAASPAPLARWQTALAGRAGAPVTWLAMGDSITEGQGATARDRRWLELTASGVRKAYPTRGARAGAGYLPGWDYVAAPSSWTPWSARTGTVTDVERPTSLGELTAQLAQGASQTYTVSGTAADVLYDSVAGGGTFTWQVDGGRPTSVATNGKPTPANVVRVRFARRGTHTVTVTAARGTVYLEGLRGYDGNESRGLRLVADAHAGYTSADYLADRSGRARLLGLVAPDLVTIAWGANDYLSATATPAQLRANLVAQVADLRQVLSKKRPSIVLVVTYPLGSGPNSLGYSWADYAAAIRSVAAADRTLGLLDLGAADVTGANLGPDGVHPTDAGYASIARVATAYLTRR